ncbi:MAG: hypothetical protein ACXADB_00980 [Candidatus Hermodarchaeia archaeon]|jgi:F0F1-type ATP synthase epsilon subunit
MADEKKFRLKVRSREGVVYEGDVTSISSFNEKGKFDVLAQHTNFITLIQKKLIIRDIKGTQKEIEVGNALLRVKDNTVEVYLGVATKPSK